MTTTTRTMLDYKLISDLDLQLYPFHDVKTDSIKIIHYLGEPKVVVLFRFASTISTAPDSDRLEGVILKTMDDAAKYIERYTDRLSYRPEVIYSYVPQVPNY